MAFDGLASELVRFFKTARHLWGRCPNCGAPFRLSDAAISTSPNPPRDWIKTLERQQAANDAEAERLKEEECRLENLEAELSDRDADLAEQERDLRQKEKQLERDAKSRAMEMLKSDAALNARVRDASQAAVMKSRSVLLGKMLECIAPCFRRFGHDPRDMRSIFNPVDYIVFDGLTIDRAVQEVTFIEVKCGMSRLSSAQRSIRNAIEKRRVRWEQWEIGDPRIPITQQLATSRNKQLPSASRGMKFKIVDDVDVPQSASRRASRWES